MSEMPKKSLSLLYCIADFVGWLRNSQFLGGIYCSGKHCKEFILDFQSVQDHFVRSV